MASKTVIPQSYGPHAELRRLGSGYSETRGMSSTLRSSHKSGIRRASMSSVFPPGKRGTGVKRMGTNMPSQRPNLKLMAAKG